MTSLGKSIIVVDSREQKPYRFSDEVQVQTGALKCGDYSLLNFENDIVIERKELGDLLNCITHDRARFERELRQFRGYRLAILMIESTWPDLMAGLYGGRAVNSSAVLSSLMAFTMRYSVTPILCGDHATGAALTEKILKLFARLIERDYRALARSSVADAGKTADGEQADDGGATTQKIDAVPLAHRVNALTGG